MAGGSFFSTFWYLFFSIHLTLISSNEYVNHEIFSAGYVRRMENVFDVNYIKFVIEIQIGRRRYI